MKPAYAERLSTRIWFRAPDRPCRFWFSADAAPHLAIERATERGRAQFTEFLTAMKPRMPEGARAHLGVLLTDPDQRYVFAGPTMSLEVLGQIAGVVHELLPQAAGLSGLMDAGVATASVNVRDDAEVNALSLDALDVQRDPGLWDGLLPATASVVADEIGRTEPGDRVWYWLADRPQGDAPVVLVQAVSRDPARDRIDHLIAQMSPDGLDDGATGVATVVDDGTLQLFGSDLSSAHLHALADWVTSHVGDHPALARFRGAQLLVVGDDGRVARILADDALWAEVPAAVVPGTLAATASALEALAAGDHAFFFATRRGNDGPFLLVERAEEDGFKARAEALFRRFPGSAADAIVGSVTRLPSGALLFSTDNRRVKPWTELIEDLVEAHGSTLPALTALSGARLVVLRDGQPRAVLS